MIYKINDVHVLSFDDLVRIEMTMDHFTNLPQREQQKSLVVSVRSGTGDINFEVEAQDLNLQVFFLPFLSDSK